MNRYLIVIERGETSYGAYSPDLPGCYAVGETLEETEARMVNAMRSHIEFMREEGKEVPTPTTAAASFVILDTPERAGTAA